MENYISKLVSMIVQDLRQNNMHELVELVKNSDYVFEFTYHDNWNSGIDYYDFILFLKYSEYVNIECIKEEYELRIEESINKFHSDDTIVISKVSIKPKVEHFVDWSAVTPEINKEILIKLINEEKETLIKVGTGKLDIKANNHNPTYIKNHKYLVDTLKKLGLSHVHNYSDLWDWFSDYKEQRLDTYESRRKFIRKLYSPIIELIEKSEEQITNLKEFEPTGWDHINSDLKNIKKILLESKTVSDYQDVGMRSRELFITVAQTVYDKDKHPSVDNTEPSETDSKRMLENYIAYCFDGKRKPREIKYVKSAIDFSSELTHKRTATRIDAELCYCSLISLINIIWILNKENS